MQRPTTDQQDRLHHDFTAALDLLDKENREPDRWEEECLSYALGALACGLYLAAEVELGHHFSKFKLELIFHNC